MSESTGQARAPTVTAQDRALFRRLGDLERELPKSSLSPPPRTLAQVVDEMEAIERAWPWAQPLPESRKDFAHHCAVRKALLRLSRREA